VAPLNLGSKANPKYLCPIQQTVEEEKTFKKIKIFMGIIKFILPIDIPDRILFIKGK